MRDANRPDRRSGQEPGARASQKKRMQEGDYISVVSDLHQPYLSPGTSSRHTLSFLLLTTLELEVSFKVGCPKPELLSYPSENGTWEKKHIFGGLPDDLRIAHFDNDVTVDADFASRGESRDQRLSLKTETRRGDGPWQSDVELDHPITVID
jgi:hypothetical protein